MTPDAPRSGVAAIVLAAGRSERMGDVNKLATEVGGRPLARIAVDAARNSRADQVVVVTGHGDKEVRAALSGLEGLDIAHNPAFAGGLSTSLRTGLDAVRGEMRGAIVLLGDMPGVDAATVDSLLDTFDESGGAAIVVATAAGRRGNPVVWPRELFGALGAVTGDTGGRQVIEAHPERVRHVEVGAAARGDIDTPADLRAARAAEKDR